MLNQDVTAAYSPRTAGPTPLAMAMPPSPAAAAAATLKHAVRAITAPVGRLRRAARTICRRPGDAGACTLNGCPRLSSLFEYRRTLRLSGLILAVKTTGTARGKRAAPMA